MVTIKNIPSPCFSIRSTGPYFTREITKRKLTQDVTKKIKGTVMQIEKTLNNDRLRVLKVS